MALPQTQANVVGSHVYPIADLGLASTVTSAANVDSEVITTGYPATLVILSKLTSGSGTLKVDIAATAGAINYSSPTLTMSLSGTSLQAGTVDTTASELFVGLQQSSGSSMVFDQLAVLVLYELTAGEEWFEVKSSINAVGNSTVGDSSGVIDLDIA